MTQPLQFKFVDDVSRVAAESPGVVEVPVGLRDKQQLMDALVHRLPLPDYFGGNWDALDECLRDRLLDGSGEPLHLLHRDLPLDQDEEACCDYLLLLDDTLAWAHGKAACDFAVLFPAEKLSAIQRIVGRDAPS